MRHLIAGACLALFAVVGASAHAQCLPQAARHALDGEQGYQSRPPSSDPYCEGLFRQPTAYGDALSLEVLSVAVSSTLVEPGTKPWEIYWPFVEGLQNTRIEAVHQRGDITYRMDAVEVSPDTPDEGDDVELFVWPTATLAHVVEERQLPWRGIQVRVRADQVQDRFVGVPRGSAVYMPILLNPTPAKPSVESVAVRLRSTNGAVQVRSMNVCRIDSQGVPGPLVPLDSASYPAILTEGLNRAVRLPAQMLEQGLVRLEVVYAVHEGSPVQPAFHAYVYCPPREFYAWRPKQAVQP